MADAVWVGVDLGTQSVRTVAVGSTGTVLSAAARPLTSSRDGNRHEQDPQAEQVALDDPVGTLDFCGTSHGIHATLQGQIRYRNRF